MLGSDKHLDGQQGSVINMAAGVIRLPMTGLWERPNIVWEIVRWLWPLRMSGKVWKGNFVKKGKH